MLAILIRVKSIKAFEYSVESSLDIAFFILLQNLKLFLNFISSVKFKLLI